MQTLFLVGYSCHEAICFRFWLLWRNNFAEHLFINRSHEPDTPTKVSCLLLPSWALLISRRILLVGAIFVNWESTGKIFEIGIICVERIIFKIGIICVERIIFKIGIIWGISFNNFASSFDLSTWKWQMMTLYRAPAEVYLWTHLDSTRGRNCCNCSFGSFPW